jgi:hypothetical protein
MATTHAFAHELANTRLEWLESFGNAQVQVEEPMIHGANGDAQAPSIFHGPRLGVAGHGLQARGARLGRIDGDGF